MEEDDLARQVVDAAVCIHKALGPGLLESAYVAALAKSVQSIEPIHVAQVLSYLRLSHLKLGILLNFNVPVMKAGIKRVVNEL